MRSTSFFSLRTHALGAALLTSALGALFTACGDSGENPGGGGTGGNGSGAQTTGGNGSGASGVGGEGQGGAVIPGEHPRIYLNDVQRTRLNAALSANTQAATRYVEFVDSALSGGDPYAFEGWHAALLYALTGDTSYADLAIAEVDAMVAEDEALVAGGDTPNVAFDSYLEVGPRVGDMALVYDWCFDRVTQDQRDRWIAWGNQAVYNVWHPEQATWGGQSMPWSGWSIDNPVNNYYFSFLRATMLLALASYEENPEAPALAEFFRQTKIEEQLVPTYEAKLQGGGSREGTGYGVAMMNLFRLYDLWEQSTGERIAGLTSHTQASIAYLTHAIVPTRDRLAPIGDHARDSTASLFDYHRDYLLVLGALYPNAPATLASRTLLASSSVPEMSQGFMRFSDFLYDPTGLETAPLESLYPAYYAPGVGHAFVRSDWSESATWLSFIAGDYDESHAHHDQGSLLVYSGEWLAYDANIDSHSGIRQEEELHNLVRIEDNGDVVRMREDGAPTNLIALHDDANVSYFAADAAPNYAGQAPVDKVLREIVFVKPDIFVVRDRVSTTSASARRVYQLNTPISPTVMSGRAHMGGGSGALDLFVVRPANVTPSIVDWAATDGDMNGGFRLEIPQQGTAETVFLTVLGVNDAASSVAASGADGVAITLSGGGTLTVTFDANGEGAVIDAPDFDATVGPGVDTLPLLAP
ncbi:MAG: hypothetical protein U0271_11620 [Polyangiaceae bacterium]